MLEEFFAATLIAIFVLMFHFFQRKTSFPESILSVFVLCFIAYVTKELYNTEYAICFVLPAVFITALSIAILIRPFAR